MFLLTNLFPFWVKDKNQKFSLKEIIQLKYKDMIKYITINAYQVGLVFERGKLTDVLREGNFWIVGNKEVKLFEMIV